MKYLLDTNICIYALKGLYSIPTKLLEHSPRDIKIPSIVKAELLYGAKKSQHHVKTEEIIKQFLFPFEIIPFDNTAAEIYADLRSGLEKDGQVIGPNDLIIAATVLAEKGILVTNNQKEFQRVKELSLDNWC